MDIVLDSQKVHPVAPARPQTGAGAALLLLLLVTLCVWFALSRVAPPQAGSATAPVAEFSSGRARAHVEAVAASPRPVGSVAHASARDYIFGQLAALGLEPEVQEAVAVSQSRGLPYQAATIRNVVATLKGGASEGAVMLVGHYDSAPTSAGASDNGSAVAAMLETARALKAGSPPKQDVIFLFTDAEEVGLLGAQAFVEGHPRAKDVRLVLNFDARGGGGPLTMFETSAGNGRLVAGYAEGAPRPFASSLFGEVYKLLPNTTDMTVFKEAGLAGLNFALVKDAVYYHTALDTVETMDERSLQHQGSTALALTRGFANQNLSELKAGDAVYFDLAGLSVVSYSREWVLPVMMLGLVTFALMLSIGFSTGRMTFKGLGLGFAALLCGVVGSAVVVTAAWWAVRAMRGYESFLAGDVYGSGIYMLGFGLLAAAVTAALFGLLLRRASAEGLAAGALVWWLLLTVATSVALPGASYLFAWPLVFSAVALCVACVLAKRGVDGFGRALVLLAGALPVLVLLVPMIYLVFLGLTLSMAGAVAVLIALAVGLLVPHLGLLMGARRWPLPAGLALASLLLITVGLLTGGFDSNRRRPNSLLYALNADTSRAVWASADASVDGWTGQFFREGATRAALEEFFPFSARPFIQAAAPAVAMNAPLVELRGDETKDGVRTIRLHVTSERRSPVVTVALDRELQVIGGALQGRRLEDRSSTHGEPWAVRYYGLPAEGLDLTLELNPSRPVSLRVIEQAYGLARPESAPDTARPANMMPSMLPFSDSTFISKSYTF